MIDRSFPLSRWVRTAGFAVCMTALALGPLACARQPGQPQIAAANQARAQKLIDSGNDAYKIGDYRLAARRYAAAAVIRKDDPAAYFGMGMALTKLGRDEDARAAYQRARELTKQRAALEFKGAPPSALPGTVPPPPPESSATTRPAGASPAGAPQHSGR